MAPTNLIRHSLELAAGRCEDITPMVYRRLFRQHPEAEAMFRSEGGDLVKGSMLALAIDAMLDFAGDRSGHFRMIECEVASHEAYGTPRELFGEFSARSPTPYVNFSATTGRRKWSRPGETSLVRSIRSSRR